MLVVDASCVVQMLTGRVGAEQIRKRLELDDEHAVPHAVDVEVFGVIRRDLLHGRIDSTTAEQAIDDLRSWPAERFGHRMLLPRAWELRASVGGWDAMYVALAEALDATLITLDRRLASASGPRCAIEGPIG